MHGRSDSDEAGHEARRTWLRIEQGRPKGYLEHNVVEGRSQVDDVLTSWLLEPAAETVLDLGCGHGATARLLTLAGIVVTAMDCRSNLTSWREVESARFLVGDARNLPFERDRFSAVLVREVLEEMTASERTQFFAALAMRPARRLLLVTRLAGRWQRFSGSSASLPGLATVDSVEILRRVHLGTPYQLVRRKEITSRNYRAQVAEFHCPHGGADDSTGF